MWARTAELMLGIWLVLSPFIFRGTEAVGEWSAIHVAAGAASAVLANDALWVTSGGGKHLTRINPHNNEIVETIEVGPNPGVLNAWWAGQLKRINIGALGYVMATQDPIRVGVIGTPPGSRARTPFPPAWAAG